MIKAITKILFSIKSWIGALFEISEASYNETIIITLIIIIAILFCFSLLFVFITLYLRLKNYQKAQTWNHLEEKWKHDILEILSEDKKPQELTQNIQDNNKLYFIDYLFRFALRIKGVELDILSEVARPFTDILLDRLEEGDQTQKVRALITLDKLKIYQIKDEQYYRLLRDPSPLVSLYTARSMIRQNKREYVKKVILTLPKYDHWSYRVLSNILIGAGENYTELFRKYFLSKTLPTASRVVIGHTLLILHDIEAAKTAEKILQSSEDPALIQKCLEIIANTGSTGHRSIVKSFIKSKIPEVKAMAFKALGTIGEVEDLDLLKDAFLQEPNKVALEAARALKKFKADDFLGESARRKDNRSQIARFVLQGNYVS